MYQIISTRKSAVMYLNWEYGTKRANELLRNITKHGSTMVILPFHNYRRKRDAQFQAQRAESVVSYYQGKLNKDMEWTGISVY